MDEHAENEFYCRGFSPPPATPSACVAQPASLPSPGPDWARPGELPWPDAELRRAYCDSRGAFCRLSHDGFRLAYPLSCRLPFPLVAIFCFARVECLNGRGWWVFSFDPGGLPRFPHA